MLKIEGGLRPSALKVLQTLSQITMLTLLIKITYDS